MSKEEKIELEKAIDKKIKKIDSTMALEGRPLTKEFKETLKKCFYGTTTTEKEREKILERYKQIGLNKVKASAFESAG